ncbi:hypothetical protein JTB14_011528 [Gonioctena quinquepunctata]|nr:hypothetical protein JTB14_011528 [Gonioctena quinquepunctata]
MISVLKEINLKQSSIDPFMFVSEDGGQVVAIYVDDLLVLGSEMKGVQEVEDVPEENFEVTCFGTPRLLLSIQISWFENRVTSCQELYILKILDKYKMSDCKPSPTPMDCGAKPQAARAEDEKTVKTEYQSKIGSLLYLAAGTRPDIMFAVNALSQFSSNPTKVHLNMVNHIFRDLKGLARKTLVYMKTDEVEIFMYTDASYASTIDDRKSQSGFIGFYGKAAVTWTSKKQKSVALSSTEAEYIALSLTCRQVMCMSYLVKDLKIKICPLLLCDNQAAIHISSNCVMHQRSKHIDVHFHYVKERILGQDVKLSIFPQKKI